MAVKAQQLADESGHFGPDGLARAARILAVAVAAVEDYAPGAPDVLKDEAVYRFGGYLIGSDYGQVAKETVGPQAFEYPINHASAFRNCGAAMLLTRYRVRRARAVGA